MPEERGLVCQKLLVPLSCHSANWTLRSWALTETSESLQGGSMINLMLTPILEDVIKRESERFWSAYLQRLHKKNLTNSMAYKW